MKFKSKAKLETFYYYTDDNNVRLTKICRYEADAKREVFAKIRVSLPASEKEELLKCIRGPWMKRDYDKYNRTLEGHLNILLTTGEVILHAI